MNSRRSNRTLNSEPEQVRLAALECLSRREYGLQELQLKLQARFSRCVVVQQTELLYEQGLQSDQRFADAMVRYRSQQGKGPLRLRQELRLKGVEDAIVTKALEQDEVDWFQLCYQLACRRWTPAIDQDYKQRQKLMRFLGYRGFTPDQISETFSLLREESCESR